MFVDQDDSVGPVRALLAGMLLLALCARLGCCPHLTVTPGPAGPYVAGGPVGPDGSLKVIEPLKHSVLDHADPAGQHAVIQEVLEPLEHSVLDHADPAGQHAVVREVLEPLEHSVLDTALDGRPMEGIPALETLEHSVLEMSLDGGPLEEISDWEPVAHSVLNVTLDGRPMEGIPDLEQL